ncbi:MFS transporter [Streptomyces sp. C1-1]|uniref:MFS transporter n=1 Tax=Streptomyces sp. C1-1 TaxID=3231173 RepID=UPI003D07A213
MTPTTAPDTTGAASRTSTSDRNVWTVVLCWITVMLEGYDLVVLGAIIPTLLKTRHLGMTAADATTVATLSLVGVAIGAVLVGPLADRFGRRLLLIGSVVEFSVFTLLVPLATSVGMFAALRLVAGIALGACMPASLTMMAEHMPAARRADHDRLPHRCRDHVPAGPAGHRQLAGPVLRPRHRRTRHRGRPVVPSAGVGGVRPRQGSAPSASHSANSYGRRRFIW